MTEIDFPEIPRERENDVYNLEIVDRADLTVFMAGNQFMLVPELLREFQALHNDIVTIAYETLPPGLELDQIISRGFKYQGKLFKAIPDVYSSVSHSAMQLLVERGIIDKNDYFIYLHNKLALMVREGNPKSIHSVEDLAREDVIVSQPNPKYEHIAEHITRMYEQAGGQELIRAVLEEKKDKGKTILTTVHHRETPDRLIKGEADVGPVWFTEIMEAYRQKLRVQGVEVSPKVDQRDGINYYITPLLGCRNHANALRFLEFIKSPQAQGIFEKYGFISIAYNI